MKDEKYFQIEICQCLILSKLKYFKCIQCYVSYSVWVQCGPLDVEIISEEFIVMLRQLSYAIKNQLKAPKAPY